MNNSKKWTGERLEPFITNETMYEHLHRYAIANELVKGKKVLDIACGEGYGCNLLSKNAAHVTGVDIDKTTIERAKLRYTASNITFLTGSILQIPFENNSFDIITCFETLEHLSNHELLLSELKRVLTPSGLLLISTPEKSTYSDKTGNKNIFHKKELYGDEFKALINHFFENTLFLTQTSFSGSLIHDDQKYPIQSIFSGNYENIQTEAYFPVMYWIGIASDNELPILSTSLFQNMKTIAQIQIDHAEELKMTLTYRIGNFILFPFKYILRIFGK